jgi:hypothetical protein
VQRDDARALLAVVERRLGQQRVVLVARQEDDVAPALDQREQARQVLGRAVPGVGARPAARVLGALAAARQQQRGRGDELRAVAAAVQPVLE